MPGLPTGIAAAALRAAARALDTAHAQARADTAAGGCAHHTQSPAYQPPPRLREHVIARDVTCRRDHQLKQHPRWKLEQTQPGHFTWTTPAGRTYTVSPDTHPL